MKKRILWLGLSFLLVASSVLSSSAKEEIAPGEQEEVVVPAPGEPQYGRTITWIFWVVWKWDMSGWDTTRYQPYRKRKLNDV